MGCEGCESCIYIYIRLFVCFCLIACLWLVKQLWSICCAICLQPTPKSWPKFALLFCRSLQVDQLRSWQGNQEFSYHVHSTVYASCQLLAFVASKLKSDYLHDFVLNLFGSVMVLFWLTSVKKSQVFFCCFCVFFVFKISLICFVVFWCFWKINIFNIMTVYGFVVDMQNFYEACVDDYL